jgi:hypothetical protein
MLNSKHKCHDELVESIYGLYKVHPFGRHGMTLGRIHAERNPNESGWSKASLLVTFGVSKGTNGSILNNLIRHAL